MGEMASGAADRGRNGLCLGGNVSRCRLLLQIGPFQLREIDSELAHVGRIDGRGDRRHYVVLAGAAFEVAELIDQVAGVLAPNYRNVLLCRAAGLAVAGRSTLAPRFPRLLRP